MFTQEQQEMYLICSTPKHGWDGNSLLFWGKNSCGHTSNVNKAQLYSIDEIYEHCHKDSKCVPIKLKDIFPYVTMHVEHAYDLLDKAQKEWQ